MLVQLYWIMKTNYMQIYNFFEKNKTQHKHSKCLNLLKLKHNIKLLIYEHYQVKDMKLKHDIKLLVYEHYQVKESKNCD